MSSVIKIYCDSGADIGALKPFADLIVLYQYPYDSKHRNKKMEIEGLPILNWQYANTTWEESKVTWEYCKRSEIYDSIATIVGKLNDKDILHLDSAYKSGCCVFLTSDKKDISSKKLDLEPICKFKIFYHKDEQQIRDYINRLLSSTMED